MSLPPAAGSQTAKGDKVLLPSFESCLISRSYEIEVRIRFDRGNEVTLRIPTSIVAKPSTAAAEAAFFNAIRIADNWAPPGQGAVAGEVEPQVLRPAQFNLINDSDDSDDSDIEGSMSNSPPAEAAPLAAEIVETRFGSPPDYSLVTVPIDHEKAVGHRATAITA